MKRRKFLKLLAISGGAVVLPVLKACSAKQSNHDFIRVKMSGANASRGHNLRQKEAATLPNTGSISKKVVIIGAGASGLTAAYALRKLGIKDLIVLELNETPGGNAISGSNDYSAYPYGAHYLSLPNLSNKRLLEFLFEKGIITDFIDGKPVYNETDLCFDPEERLLYKGTFQEGLIPTELLSQVEKDEIKRFFQLIDEFRNKKGKDEKYFFQIPNSESSEDNAMNYLDEISFKDFLKKENYTSTPLLWYLNYCCADDFGAGIENVSAWAGIHYFAAHRGEAHNTDSTRVLTWPEGNHRLIKMLLEGQEEIIRCESLVQNITIRNNKVIIRATDFKNKITLDIESESCIVSGPVFANKYILNPNLGYPVEIASRIQHFPWVVAAVTLEGVPHGRGIPLCWDNVAFGTRSLGYINNQHQSLNQQQKKSVISLYLPLNEKSGKEERQKAYNKTSEEWKEIILFELEKIHSGITKLVEEIDIHIWGHGMALPAPGLLRSGILKELSKPIQNKIFFAHTDLSGYSTFEEAFDQGWRAALEIEEVFKSSQ